jgi:hypothetical protein
MPQATVRNQLTGVVLALVVATAPAANVAAQEESSDVAQSCVRPTNIDRTRIIDDRNILFFMRDETVYRNMLTVNCPQLRSEGRFAYDKTGNRLCAGSPITVIVENGGQYLPGPVCRIGMFAPLTEDEVEELLALSKQGKRGRKSSAASGTIEAKPVELPPGATAPANGDATSPQSAPGDASQPDAPTDGARTPANDDPG